jgi:hypothetical protein
MRSKNLASAGLFVYVQEPESDSNNTAILQLADELNYHS